MHDTVPNAAPSLRPAASLLLLSAVFVVACAPEAPLPPAEPTEVPSAAPALPARPEPEVTTDPTPPEPRAGRALPGPGVGDRVRAAPVEPALSAEHAARRNAAREAAAASGPAAGLALLDRAEEELGASGPLRLERARLHLVVAETAGEDGALAAALRALDEADALVAGLPGAAVLRARILVLAGDAAAARETLRTHVERFPGDAEAHRELGLLHVAAKEWAPADTHLSLAAELDPADGLARLRATYAKQWLTAEGGAAYTPYALRQGYREAARLLPEDDEPLRLVVGLYPERSPRRLQALRDVVTDRPDAVRARLRIGRLLLDGPDARPEDALPVLDAARDHAEDGAPVLAEVEAARARALAALGRVEEAVRADVVALSADDPALRRRVSNHLDALLHPGDPERPVPLDVRVHAADALVSANPDDGRFGNNAGFWFREVARDHEASLRYYLAAVEASPGDQDYLNDTGFLYLEHLRDWKERCEPLFLEARRLVEEEGHAPTRGYWDALEHLCRYYFEIGRHHDVIVCADLRAGPDAPYPSTAAASYRKRAQAKLDAGR